MFSRLFLSKSDDNFDLENLLNNKEILLTINNFVLNLNDIQS